jgi:hypothetical protein
MTRLLEKMQVLPAMVRIKQVFVEQVAMLPAFRKLRHGPISGTGLQQSYVVRPQPEINYRETGASDLAILQRFGSVPDDG